MSLHENKERSERLQYHRDSPRSYGLAGGNVSLHQTLWRKSLLFFITICRASINVSPVACNSTVSLALEPLVLYGIDSAPVGSFRARQRGSLSSRTAGPLLRLAGCSRDRDYYWDWGIYRTSGWASSFSPSPSPPICLCGFIKGPDGLSETGFAPLQ